MKKERGIEEAIDVEKEFAERTPVNERILQAAYLIYRNQMQPDTNF